jgi:hypothetical protein
MKKSSPITYAFLLLALIGLSMTDLSAQQCPGADCLEKCKPMVVDIRTDHCFQIDNMTVPQYIYYLSADRVHCGDCSVTNKPDADVWHIDWGGSLPCPYTVVRKAGGYAEIYSECSLEGVNVCYSFLVSPPFGQGAGCWSADYCEAIDCP